MRMKRQGQKLVRKKSFRVVPYFCEHFAVILKTCAEYLLFEISNHHFFCRDLTISGLKPTKLGSNLKKIIIILSRSLFLSKISGFSNARNGLSIFSNIA